MEESAFVLFPSIAESSPADVEVPHRAIASKYSNALGDNFATAGS